MASYNPVLEVSLCHIHYIPLVKEVTVPPLPQIQGGEGIGSTSQWEKELMQLFQRKATTST